MQWEHPPRHGGEMLLVIIRFPFKAPPVPWLARQSLSELKKLQRFS